MKNSKYRQCQDCKKVFKVRKPSINNLLICPFCNGVTIAIISRQTYDDYYINKVLLKNKNLEVKT